MQTHKDKFSHTRIAHVSGCRQLSQITLFSLNYPQLNVSKCVCMLPLPNFLCLNLLCLLCLNVSEWVCMRLPHFPSTIPTKCAHIHFSALHSYLYLLFCCVMQTHVSAQSLYTVTFTYFFAAF